MTTAVIIQARFASTRAPGKVLATLAGRAALTLVLERCAQIPRVDVVVCAVSRDAASDCVAEVAERAGAIVTRGSQTDVLARYAQAARVVSADVVLRVTSDCPFIDPFVCGEVLAWRAETKADYACNNAPGGFPHGLDCEAMTADALHASARESNAPETREHVTPDLRRNPRWRRARILGPGSGVEQLRWTLDWPEDVLFAQALASEVPSLAAADWATLAELCWKFPGVTALNANRVDEQRLATLSAAANDQTLWPAELARISASRTPAR
jgi:spore coat polysaccharide biosynthesis protein SpsF (cytidylyltransferase family)